VNLIRELTLGGGLYGVVAGVGKVDQGGNEKKNSLVRGICAHVPYFSPHPNCQSVHVSVSKRGEK